MFRSRRALERENAELRAQLNELHDLVAAERQEIGNRPATEGNRAVPSSPSEGRSRFYGAGRYA